MSTGASCPRPQLLAAASPAPNVLFLLLLPLLSWAPGLGCRTEHFPVPNQCGAEAPGGVFSLPWMVTVRVEALTDVQEPEDLLPCPSVFQHEVSFNGSAHPVDGGGRGPDSFFGHVARVAVTHKLTSTCAGVVVTARHVLTAAHCLFAPRYKPTYRVFFRNGSSTAHGPRRGHLHVGFAATAALCHPGCRFHGTTRAVNDLAVLLLAEPVDIHAPGQGAVCLPWPDVQAHGAVLWIARHEGRPKGVGGSRLPTTLTRESVQLVNCSLIPHTVRDHAAGGEPSNELCTVSSGSLRDMADPGTALMVDTVHGWVLVGLLSWLDEVRAAPTSVAVFTDVSALMPWLLETIFKTF